MRRTLGQYPITLAIGLLLLSAPGCAAKQPDRVADDRVAERLRMVRTQIDVRGIRDPRVLEAMRTVPRHLFVPESRRALAYSDRAVPIGEGQTISQPFVVALMTELADIRPGDRVLEIGTGSGYQTAVLAEMGARVFTIEILAPLSRRARDTIGALGCPDIRFRIGDGYAGWPGEAPFDRILVTAAPPEIPETLLEQLGPGGRLVAPVGPQGRAQRLTVVERDPSGLHFRDRGDVFFVPMIRSGQRPGSGSN